MINENQRDFIIARLIANTRRLKRPNNLIEIAQDIRWLEKDLGNLKEVSKILSISRDMLGQFLTVEDLCPEVKELVRSRKIDLIKIVRNIHNLNPNDQQFVVGKLLNGEISPNDIKVLEPLRNKFRDTDISQLITRVNNSKNIKLFVMYFKITGRYIGDSQLRERLRTILGQDRVIRIEHNEIFGIIEIDALGKKKLLFEAKSAGLSLRKLVEDLVNDGI